MTVFAILMTILFMNGEKLGIAVISDGDNDGTSDSVYFSANDLNASWSTEGATHIALNGDDCEVTGSGAYFLDGDLYIVQSGYYVLSGELTDGSLIVEASSKARIWIMLDGVKITASDDAAFRINQAKKVFMTLAEGSTNTFTDGKDMSEEALADGTNACVFVHDNLTINGSGTLRINGNYRNGITAKDNLVIAGGNISISAAGDGIRVNEKLKIRDAQLDITAEDDGMVIKNNSTDTDKSTDGNLEGNREDDTVGDTEGDSEDKAKMEGAYLYIMSGKISIVSKDDAVNSIGEVTVDGGNIVISAADDAVHSETNVYINGGTILINECYEGIEALTITMTGGDVTIYPSDDGFNASGGSNGTLGMGGGLSPEQDMNGAAGGDRPTPPDGNTAADGSDRPTPPEGNTATDGSTRPASDDGTTADSSSIDSAISISGGRLTIINKKGNDCDGLDSNGSIYISGGEIRISLPGSGTNAAIDYGSESGGVCVITGGSVIACGGSEMIEGFDETSRQASILYYLSDGAGDGSLLSLKDAEGNTLLEYEVPVGFTSVNISCPEIKTGETYILTVADTSEEIVADSIATTVGNASGSRNAPGMQNMQPGGDMGTGFGPDFISEEEDPGDTSDMTVATADTKQSWAMIGASGGVMLLGLFFAMIYRKKEF